MAEALSPAELAAAFGDAVYRIESDGCGVEGVGSGFAISERFLITNWHVVAFDVTPVVRSRSGQTTTGRVIGWSEDPDIAVIEVTEDMDVILQWAESTELGEGAELASMGYPLPDHDFSVTPGAVLSFIKEGSRRVAIRTDASVDRGSSGGPALTDRGAVAGVVTQIDLNWDGFQFVPLIVTYDALADTVERIIERPSRPSADCDDPILASGSDSDGYDSDSGYPDPYDPFWAVILASMDVGQYTMSDALVRAAGYEGQSIPAEVLLSSDFASLNPGYWVVYVRSFSTRQAASDYCSSIKSVVDSCYARYISWDSSYR